MKKKLIIAMLIAVFALSALISISVEAKPKCIRTPRNPHCVVIPMPMPTLRPTLTCKVMPRETVCIPEMHCCFRP